jgi:hypothetical protein
MKDFYSIKPQAFDQVFRLRDQGCREGMPLNWAEPREEKSEPEGRLLTQCYEFPELQSASNSELWSTSNLTKQVDHGQAFRTSVELGALNWNDHGRDIEAAGGFISTSLRIGTPDLRAHSEPYSLTFGVGNDGEYPEPLLTETNDSGHSATFDFTLPLNEVTLVPGSSTAGFSSQRRSQLISGGSPEGFRGFQSNQSTIRPGTFLPSVRLAEPDTSQRFGQVEGERRRRTCALRSPISQGSGRR